MTDYWLDRGLGILRDREAATDVHARDALWRMANLCFDRYSEAQEAESPTEAYARVCRFLSVEPPPDCGWTETAAVLKDFLEHEKELSDSLGRLEEVNRDLHLEVDRLEALLASAERP